MKFKALGLAAAMTVALAGPAFAHHSFAMFNADKTLTLTGTVKDFQWTNPHSWLQVVVMGNDGKPVEWSLEMGSPSSLARLGWRPHVVKAGDKVTVDLHPLKDGSSGGQLIGVKLPDGRVLGSGQKKPAKGKS